MLTTAEQSVVESLVEGHGVKTIARDRDVSENTIRRQRASAMGKLKVSTCEQLGAAVVMARIQELRDALDRLQCPQP